MALAEGRCLPKRKAGIPQGKYDRKRDQVATDYDGLCGEYAAATALRTHLDEELYLHGDPGYDLILDGETVQVKYNHYPYGDLYVNTPDELTADIAVLTTATARPDVVRVAGWTRREAFLSRHRAKNYGYGRRCAMAQDELEGVTQCLTHGST